MKSPGETKKRNIQKPMEARTEENKRTTKIMVE
jgi:hypothetical protein